MIEPCDECNADHRRPRLFRAASEGRSLPGFVNDPKEIDKLFFGRTERNIPTPVPAYVDGMERAISPVPSIDYSPSSPPQTGPPDAHGLTTPYLSDDE